MDVKPPSMTAPLAQSPAIWQLGHPLDEFYAQAGVSLPNIEQIAGENVPPPYRDLLVHQNDMTPTLEGFYGRAIHLRLLGKRRKGNHYFREVVLLLDGTNKPVEFGAIKINLNLFSAEARKQILEEQRPLGRIMQECAVRHSSRPKAFLRITTDPIINDALEINGPHVLFGRRNSLLDPQDRPLAEIVEILPPVEPATGKREERNSESRRS
jgi:chorismate-pyruvate lyase